MKAAVLYENNIIKTEEIAPASISSGHVRITVKASGICGSDIHKMMTTWNYGLPAVMGHEFAGVISEIGEGVTKVKVGDRVAGLPFEPCGQCDFCRTGHLSLCENYRMAGSSFYGGLAESVVLKEDNVISIGDLSFEEGAMIEPLAVSMHGALGISPKVGDTILVFGAGTIGLLTIQCLALSGAKDIIAVDIDDKKLTMARQFGVTKTINSMTEDLLAKVAEFTNGQGVDIAMECAGTKITQEQCLLVTKKLGKIGYQGIAYADVTLHKDAFESIFRKELTLKGFWNSYTAPFPGPAWTNAIEFVKQGKIKLAPLITHRLSLDNVADAFNMAIHHTEAYGKIMFFPDK